jgi:hypothetical protein
MSSKGIRFTINLKSLRALAPIGVGLMVFAMAAAPAMQAGAAAPQDKTSSAEAPLVQQFEDVPDSNPFSTFVNALYLDNIISGYPCGGVGEPCGPGSLPYYRPNNNVTRAQMAKFVDNGRRNIADAVGDRLVMTNTAQVALVISSTTTDAADFSSSSGNETVQSLCTRANQNCWAFYGFAVTGDRPALFSGGRGTYAASDDDTWPALKTHSNGATAYGAELTSGAYRGALVQRDDPGYYGLFVAAETGEPTTYNGANFERGVRVEGNLTVLGSKSGYVVDAMQNADSAALQPGDVVVIVGSSAPVLGQIPVVNVRKATSAYDTAVAGVVDQALFVPDAATRKAYEAEQQAIRDAMAARSAAEREAAANGTKADLSRITVPQATIPDNAATVHATDAAQINAGGYVNVVTLGAYKAVKVDASFGAIKAGDLLTTSPNPGYAMKVTDKSQSSGAVIGKALADLESGTGTVPVMVTLK